MMENKKVISLSLVVLFLSLSIVYSLMYMKQSSLFKTSPNVWSDNNDQSNHAINQPATGNNSANLSDLTWKTNNTYTWNVTLWELISWTENINTQNQSASTSVSLLSADKRILSGTTEYFWLLDIVSILWEKPQITLQDTKWNFFAYYWNHLNFVQTIHTLWWNVYEMVTESEILQNQLFGDKVSYINLSTFKDIWVIMVIEINGDVWLLQIPADKYHQSKDYLKSLFIQ